MTEPTQIDQDCIQKDTIKCDNNHNVVCLDTTQPLSGKLSRYDTAAITLKRKNPNATPHAIAQELVKLGISKDKHTIYKRLKQSTYLQAEFATIENAVREQLVREDLPLARKALRKHLKNKDKLTPPGAQIAAAKIIYDKALADRQDKLAESPVSIQNIEQLQILVAGDVADKLIGDGK